MIRHPIYESVEDAREGNASGSRLGRASVQVRTRKVSKPSDSAVEGARKRLADLIKKREAL